MSFTPFIKPYPDGYIDDEAGDTPVTAEILNTNYDGFLLALNSWASDVENDIGDAKSDITGLQGNISNIQSALNNKVDTSTFNQLGDAVRQIGLAVNSKSTVSVSDLLQSGTKVATLTIDGTQYDLYAPSGGGGGSSVSWNQIISTGTKIATVTIDGVPTDVYVPTPIDELSNLTDVSITNLQNGQILKWNSTTLKWENSNESGGGFGLVQSGHTVYTLTGQNLEDRVSITFDTPFPEVPNVAVSLSNPSRGQYYNPQTGLGVMNVTKNGFDILIKSSNQAVAGDILIYWIATTKFSGNGIFHPTIYSTEEREIGVWKDGRPLYQKTVDFGALPNNTTKTVSYNISDLDYFVKIQCVAHNQNGSRNIPFVDDASKNGDVLLDTIKSSGVIRIIANTDLSSLTGDVTLQYVKSTDTAGSGSWTPQGVPTHHYSTDEQVIGTWIDGSTLYEKTITIQKSSISSGNNTINHLINNFGQLVKKEIIYNYSNGDMNTDLANPTNGNYRMEVGDIGSTDFTLFIGTSAFSLISVIYATLRYTKTS